MSSEVRQGGHVRWLGAESPQAVGRSLGAGWNSGVTFSGDFPSFCPGANTQVYAANGALLLLGRKHATVEVTTHPWWDTEGQGRHF